MTTWEVRMPEVCRCEEHACHFRVTAKTGDAVCRKKNLSTL
jgi:hypothetical protein